MAVSDSPVVITVMGPPGVDDAKDATGSSIGTLACTLPTGLLAVMLVGVLDTVTGVLTGKGCDSAP